MLSKFLQAGVCALFSVTVGLMAASAQSHVQVTVSEAGRNPASKELILPVNKSSIIEINVPAVEVIIANPDIAEAIIRTPQRVILRGVTTGETNAFFFDAYGNQLLDLQIQVEQDVAGLEELYTRLLPDASIKVEPSNGSIILTGRVTSVSDVGTAIRLAENFIAGEDGATSGGGEEASSRVINLLAIEGKDQVLLKVRIVEMQRTLTKQLGLDIAGTSGDLTFSTTNAFSVAGTSLGGLAANFSDTFNNGDLIGVDFNAMERLGLVKTLAEPNLTAISGESAQFLAGGEYPVPVGQDDNGTVTIEFKPFGVGLGFTPVVLSGGRISLRISTEVSELSQEGAFTPETVAGFDNNGDIITVQTVNIPSLTVRRVETTVELPSGGSTVVAGLIQETTQQSLASIPGIKNVPVLGSLFRSRDFQNDETELVVIVTPYLVDPVDPSKLQTPADGFSSAGDLSTVFLGRINDLYKVPGADTSGKSFDAPVGFIVE